MEQSFKLFQIQRFSIYDGPGIRTTVFLKGCSLHCRWCHNPESIAPQTQVQFLSPKCLGCHNCQKICPQKDVPLLKALPCIPTVCADCLLCAANCPVKAIEILGEDYSFDRLENELLKDLPFFQESNGGITFSGGEPLLQSQALAAFLPRLTKHGIKCAIDTAGNVPWEAFARVLPHTDLFLYDLKALDKALHLQGTGADNTRILENFKRLYQSNAPIIVRIPLIPHFNANTAEISALATFLEDYPNIQFAELMPFHNVGQHKYESLKLPYDYTDLPSLPADAAEPFYKIFREHHIPIKTGK